MLVEGSFTLKVESEEDILLIAEIIQRKKNGLVKNAVNSNIQTGKRERAASKDTNKRIKDLLQDKFPTGEFRRDQVFALVPDKSRSTVDTSLRALVRQGELAKVRSAVFTFERNTAASENSLLELQSTPAFFDVLRITRALADKIPLSLYQSGIVSRQSDPQDHIALDVNIDKRHFSVYDVKSPSSMLVDANSLIERIQREPAARISMQKAGTLQIGMFSLTLEKCQDIEGAPPAGQAIEWKSELTIRRQELERILSDNRVNSDYVDIIADQGHVLFQSFNEKGEYPGEPISVGYTCKESTRTRLYYLDYLIKCLKAARCQTVSLKNTGSFLVTEFQIDPSIQCRLFLSCKPLQVEEVQASQ